MQTLVNSYAELIIIINVGLVGTDQMAFHGDQIGECALGEANEPFCSTAQLKIDRCVDFVLETFTIHELTADAFLLQ